MELQQAYKTLGLTLTDDKTASVDEVNAAYQSKLNLVEVFGSNDFFNKVKSMLVINVNGGPGGKAGLGGKGGKGGVGGKAGYGDSYVDTQACYLSGRGHFDLDSYAGNDGSSGREGRDGKNGSQGYKGSFTITKK